MAGSHGKTAQLCLLDANLPIDAQLFVYVLYQIGLIFFSTNHQNYACWMMLFLLEVMSLPGENPILI